MADRMLTVTRIGNSRGIRIPAETIRRYGIGDSVVMEERSDGIFLRPVSGIAKLSWEETARAMEAAKEDWSEWDVLDADGLDDLPWNPGTTTTRRVAAQPPEYGGKKPKSKKRS